MVRLDCIAQTEVLCAGAGDEWFSHWRVGEFCHRTLAKALQQSSRVESCSWFWKKKRAKDERTFIMLYIIRLSLSHGASKWKPRMPSFSPFNVHTAVLDARSPGISQLKSCTAILPRFFFSPGSLEPVDSCFSGDQSRNLNLPFPSFTPNQFATRV